jgi:hypothetical protein
MKPRSFLLDSFAILFGISAWISINGLWVELPLMVQVKGVQIYHGNLSTRTHMFALVLQTFCVKKTL